MTARLTPLALEVALVVLLGRIVALGWCGADGRGACGDLAPAAGTVAAGAVLGPPAGAWRGPLAGTGARGVLVAVAVLLQLVPSRGAGEPSRLLLLAATAGLLAMALAAHGTLAGALLGQRRLGHTLTLGLATLLATAPLWLGPVAAARAAGERIADAAVAVCPVTPLAVAAGRDFLRGEWFYQHTPLGALRYAYPGLTSLVAGWAAVAAASLSIARITLRRSSH